MVRRMTQLSDTRGEDANTITNLPSKEANDLASQDSVDHWRSATTDQYFSVHNTMEGKENLNGSTHFKICS